MIVAVDTNILIYAHREETEQHLVARKLISDYAEGNSPWALAWPCLYEFLRVVTHVKVFHPPTPIPLAWEIVTSLLDSPSLLLLTETERHRHVLADLLSSVKPAGNILHDVHIAALLLEHGVSEILTADEDFRRFPGLKTTNPFR